MSTANHLSDLELDLLAFDATATQDQRASHLAGCERCRAALQEIRGDREAFARERLGRTLPRVIERSHRGRWWSRMFFLVPALSMTVLLTLVLPRVLPGRGERGSDLGIKGDAALRAVARRGNQNLAVEPGVILRAGDLVRFEVEGAGWPFVLVASVDGEGKAVVLYPFEGDKSMSLSNEHRVVLPGSISLDAAKGPERVFALLSREPLRSSDVLPALEELGQRGAETIRATQTLPIEGAGRQLTVLWEKEAP